MIEYNYPECTTSVVRLLPVSMIFISCPVEQITSLSIFRKHYPNYRAADIS